MFRIRPRVQFAGLVSLVVVPLILVAIAVALVEISVALAIVVGLVFVFAAQIALARRWTSLSPKAMSVADAPELHALLERLCVQGGLTKPQLVVHPSTYANSWVKGTSARRATLHLTQPLLDRLDEAQLEGVVAHELAHLGQRDCMLMSLVGGPVEAMLAGASLYFHGVRGYRMYFKKSRHKGDVGDAELVMGIFPAAALILLPVGVAFLIVGELCHLVVAWFSRVRELEADAGAARLTGNPAGIASALIALNGTDEAIPLKDLRQARTMDVFHIVAMGKERLLVRTHPSLKRRLAQLDELERRLQRAHPAASVS